MSALAAAAWSAAGLVPIDITPSPQFKAVVPLKDDEFALPAVGVSSINSKENPDDVVNLARRAWGDNWDELQRKVVTLSKDLFQEQGLLTHEKCVRSILDDKWNHYLRDLQKHLEIGENLGSEFENLKTLSMQIDTLLRDDGVGSLGEKCEGYFANLDSHEEACTKELNAINGDIAKNEAPPKQMTAALPKPPKPKLAAPKSSPTGTTRGKNRIVN